MPSFDPNAAAEEGAGIFGLPHTEAQAKLVLLPVPWEATTSYGGGTARGPQCLLKASHQLDLFDPEIERPYTPGICMLDESRQVREWNERAKAHYKRSETGPANELGSLLNEYVRTESDRLLKQGKFIGVVGGDHSSPLGLIQALGQKYPEFGILHFDAHFDLREEFQGFKWSHASIMNNVLKGVPQVKKLVQVGIRDFCEQEWELAKSMGSRVSAILDTEISRRKQEGESWSRIAKMVIDQLPPLVYVSFDIDGLDPRFCPSTGTPVPGGMDLAEANAILRGVATSGRKIIGFDLCEVAPSPHSEWDANVGMRLLYKLAGWLFVSQGLIRAL